MRSAPTASNQFPGSAIVHLVKSVDRVKDSLGYVVGV